MNRYRNCPGIHRYCAHTVGQMAETVGLYRALVDVEDEEVGEIMAMLWDGEPTPLRRLRVTVIAEWLAYCRSAAMPVPWLGNCADAEWLRRV